VVTGLIASVTGACFNMSLAQSPIVDLGYAKYRGSTNGQGVKEFLGIRFAAPPVGDLRWRAPADPEPVTGIQDATAYKAICVGEGQTVSAGVLEEDCLFLNVFTPASATSKKLPVWVYIQGGGYVSDAGGNYNGTEMIAASGHDIIHVNINYRVAQLGFLGGSALGDGGDYNVGLLDQWKALEWVQSYIHLVQYKLSI
jgi:carboxylesterase type B